MAILEHDPFSINHGILDEHLSLGSLALTKRYWIKFVFKVHTFGELEQHGSGISSLSQYKDQRGADVDLFVDDVHRSRW